jgi:hypothetical protein
VKGAIFELWYVYFSRNAEWAWYHGYIRISPVCKAVGTRRIINPNPVGAIVSKPVLASVLVITSGATHFDGLLPAGSKAF